MLLNEHYRIKLIVMVQTGPLDPEKQYGVRLIKWVTGCIGDMEPFILGTARNGVEDIIFDGGAELRPNAHFHEILKGVLVPRVGARFAEVINTLHKKDKLVQIGENTYAALVQRSDVEKIILPYNTGGIRIVTEDTLVETLFLQKIDNFLSEKELRKGKDKFSKFFKNVKGAKVFSMGDQSDADFASVFVAFRLFKTMLQLQKQEYESRPNKIAYGA